MTAVNTRPRSPCSTGRRDTQLSPGSRDARAVSGHDRLQDACIEQEIVRVVRVGLDFNQTELDECGEKEL